MLTKNIFLCVFFALVLVKVNAQTTAAIYTATTSSLDPVAGKKTFYVQMTPDSAGTGMSLMISNPGKQKLQLTISHDMLGTAVDTTINCTLFNTRYLFNNAVDGHYKVLVRHRKEKFIKEIELSTVSSRCVKMY